MGFIYGHKNTKKSDKPVLKQIIDLIPKHILTTSIGAYQSDKHCSAYKTYDQLTSTMFGQLNKCMSLREISLGLSINEKLIRDIGLKQSPAKSTMSDGNEKRDWKVFEKIYFELIKYYKGVFKKQPEYKSIKEIEGKNIKLIDATIMSVSLKLFDWAKYRTAKGGIKAHVSLDELTMLPDIVNITPAKKSDRRGVDDFRYPEETIIVDDRGYFDFKLFRQRIDDKNWFVTRMKSNILYESIKELDLPDDENQDIIKDEVIKLTGKAAEEAELSDVLLRRTAVYVEQEDRKTGKIKRKVVVLISNNLDWSAETISELYKKRWQIETFFKLIKQNLQIKNFIGTSENACKSQIFISLITYFLLELIRRSISKLNHRFGHFATIIRLCLMQYSLLEYIANEIQIVVKKAKQYNGKKKYKNQISMSFNTS